MRLWPSVCSSTTETFYYLVLTWLISRGQPMFLWKEKEARETGQNTKHNHNGILTTTALTGPVMQSLTCGFQRREQEQIWIHVQQNYTLEGGEKQKI